MSIVLLKSLKLHEDQVHRNGGEVFGSRVHRRRRLADGLGPAAGHERPRSSRVKRSGLLETGDDSFGLVLQPVQASPLVGPGIEGIYRESNRVWIGARRKGTTCDRCKRATCGI